MLPEFLAGSYKRYKEDTDVFTIWLAKAAGACGYTSTDVARQKAAPMKPAKAAIVAPTAPKLKGRARMLAKKAAVKLQKRTGLRPQRHRQQKSPRHQLLVEDPFEIIDRGAVNVETDNKPAKTRATDDVMEIYEVLLDWQEDLTFMVYCFFEDMHQIQEFIMGTWQEYKDGKVDLVTASVTTNAAIDLVKRIEEDIISCSQDTLSKPDCYSKFMAILYHDNAMQEGYDLAEKLAGTKSLEISAFGGFLYLPTSRAVSAIHRMFELKIEYPQPIMPARNGYVFRPELLGLPKYKQMEREHEQLARMIVDVGFNPQFAGMVDEAMARGSIKTYHPRESSFVKGVRALRKQQEFSVCIVFACPLFLDYQTTLGDQVGRGLQELQSVGNKQYHVMDFKTELNGQQLAFGGAGERWLEKDAPVPMQIHDLVQFTVTSPAIGLLKPGWLANRVQKPSFFTPETLPEEYSRRR
ncbi:hypothetical protein LTR36_001422 [Oleoguttula mirabilis]|uniref:DUF6604 domain-containing protein n=1 Tax=Oleoguttula mirabilis TaxID=1507867 RepID=A0AAV9JNT5_9PEZI|nr:hypothetical protein LTR36_001422 [Oleoguttula mirabilis]